jgi:predicted transport protein
MTSSAITLDPAFVQQMVEQAVEDNILSVIGNLTQDPVWLEKIERMINQAVVQRTVAKIASTDINSVIHERVDSNLETVHQKFMKNFASNGIKDQASQLQLTVMDETVVIENQLVTKDLQVVGSTCVKDLTVTGSINTDNKSWHTLAEEIGRRTLDQIDQDWQDRLISQVVEKIQDRGIDFDQVTIEGSPLVSGNVLNSFITESNIKKLGHLQDLTVKGEAHIYDTVSVVNRRLGINTATPESALSVWDEEVAVIIGKHQAKQAYVGTSRDQGLVIGVNRLPQIEIDSTGLTRIKKLQVGLHKISHDVQVPGWSGTRGDLVLNSNPGPDRVFAWVCLGAHKWQTLKSAE